MRKEGKFVLFLGGGAMAGVFGAGVVYQLRELNLYNKIKAVYGSSAGAFNMAYFLAAYSKPKQIDTGASIYWENLQRHFIFPEKTALGFLERIWNRFIHKIPRRKILSVTNIDYLINVSKHKKILDIDALNKCPVPGYAKLYDIRTDKLIYKDIKKDTFEILRQSTSAIPYYSTKKKQRYVDGGMVDGKGGYDYLRKRYPNEKIVICMNFRPYDVGFLSMIKNFFEGLFASFMYPETGVFSRLVHKNRDLKDELSRIEKDKNAFLIYPPKNNPAFASTIEPKLLKESFRLGRKEAKKIIEWMNE